MFTHIININLYSSYFFLSFKLKTEKHNSLRKSFSLLFFFDNSCCSWFFFYILCEENRFIFIFHMQNELLGFFFIFFEMYYKFLFVGVG